jgi:hypothetical protein
MRREEREPLIDRGPPSANGACPQRAAGLAGTRSWVGECDVETRASVRRSCQARGQMIRRAGFLRPRRAGAMDWTGDDAPCQTCRLCHGHRRGRGRPRGVVGSPFCGVSDVLAALARSSLDPHWVTPLRVNGKVAQLFANRLAGRRESSQATSTAPGPGRREAQAARPPQLKPPGQAAAARASSSSSSSSCRLRSSTGHASRPEVTASITGLDLSSRWWAHEPLFLLAQSQPQRPAACAGCWQAVRGPLSRAKPTFASMMIR